MPTLPLTENKTLPKVVILTPQQVEELDRLKINYAVMPVRNIEQEAKTAMQLEIQRYHRAIEAYNADLLTMLEGMKKPIKGDSLAEKVLQLDNIKYNDVIQEVIDKVKGK